MILKLENISKSFRIDRKESFKALNQINLGFDKGEFVSILGPSGCGKSTLLNLIAGLDNPTEGTLYIGGKSTRHFKAKDWDHYRKNNIGFVFQQFNLIEHLSALENVEIVMTLIGLSKSKRRQRALELLKEVGIEKYATHLPGQLSGGQKQRVAIARALANNPDIILADEPTGALDTDTGLAIMQLLKSIAHNKLVIMVTHNRELAYDNSSKVISMLDGEVLSVEEIHPKNDQIEDIALSKKNRSMPFSEAFRLSLRNMKKKIGRVLITTIAGSIGIAGITLVAGLGNGANIFIDEQVIKFGNANVLQLSATKLENDETVSISDIEHFNYIKDHEHVVMIRPALSTDFGSWLVDGQPLETNSTSLAPVEYQDALNNFIRGTLPQVGQNELVINQAAARSLMHALNYDTKTTKLEDMIGKTIDFSLVNSGINETKTFTVTAIVEEIDFDAANIYFNQEDLKAFYQSIEIPFVGNFYDQVTNQPSTVFEVIVDHPENAFAVSEFINSAANGGSGSGFMGQSGVGANAFNTAIVFRIAFQTVILIIQAVIMLFLVVALIVSSILIAIVLFSSILERRVEIGILKAVGARNKDIMRVFQSEAILLGLFAGMLGVAFAFLVVPVIEPLVKQFTGFDATGFVKIPLMGTIPFTNIEIPGLLIIGLIGISVIVAAIAGYLPSKKATRMQVIDALRDE